MADARLLIVEDDEKLLELLSWHFERDGYTVTTTGDGEEAVRAAAASPPDLVLLDWMIRGLAGIEVCRRLRATPDTANVPIIMLTARGEESDRVNGLDAGADDYVTKPFSPRELLARVRAVLRRVRPALAGQVLSYADVEMNLARFRVKRSGQEVNLKPTEFRLLKHFMEHPRRVFSRERLIATVWAHDPDIDGRTVDVHIRRLRQALGVTNGMELIRTVRSAGYALDQDS
jgi:two-component system phosphate regulon response regulator PhoB